MFFKRETLIFSEKVPVWGFFFLFVSRETFLKNPIFWIYINIKPQDVRKEKNVSRETKININFNETSHTNNMICVKISSEVIKRNEGNYAWEELLR